MISAGHADKLGLFDEISGDKDVHNSLLQSLVPHFLAVNNTLAEE